MNSSAHPVLLYDGVCGLCNWLVRFVLKRDRESVFRFASLQSDAAAQILQRQGIRFQSLTTFYVVRDFQAGSERLLDRSDAAIYVLQELGGGWWWLGTAYRLLPRRVRNFFYDMVARHRYRIFGKYDVCPVPDSSVHSRFLDR